MYGAILEAILKQLRTRAKLFCKIHAFSRNIQALYKPGVVKTCEKKTCVQGCTRKAAKTFRKSTFCINEKS